MYNTILINFGPVSMKIIEILTLRRGSKCEVRRDQHDSVKHLAKDANSITSHGLTENEINTVNSHKPTTDKIKLI
jgi:hypothetical protein